ncbi:MAG: sigma-70 family RNA polymerase sigma factor [Bacteroidetes bacterium]|nr:sigma-70 family RNA polymerase sigma factor [Bacteroidota bacterium]
MTEQEIVQGCIEENIVFQEKLYKMFCGKMMGVCLRYMRSREEAEDILQEGFIKVFDKIKSFRNDGPIEAWIRRIIVNTAINQINRNKWHLASEDIDHIHDFELTSPETISDKLNANDLLKIIDKLPDGYKMVFNMFAIEGYGHKEIGEMLGISESTSKTQFLKAKKYIRELLEDKNIKHE